MIKFPKYVYDCLNKYENVALPDNNYEYEQIKNHFIYKYKRNVYIKQCKFYSVDKEYVNVPLNKIPFNYYYVVYLQ